MLSLENEMLNNHAEILHLQQELVAVKSEDASTYKTRVVAMKELPSDDKQDSKEIAPVKKMGK